jgi:hypothetical protein
VAHEPSPVSQRRQAADIVDKRLGSSKYCVRFLIKQETGWRWWVRKSWEAAEVDEVVLLAEMAKAWEKAERAGRVRRAERTEASLKESWQRPEEEER